MTPPGGGGHDRQSPPRVIDASTAHRTAPGWDYGFPELSPPAPGGHCPLPAGGQPWPPRFGVHRLVYPLVRLGIPPGLSSVRLLPHRLHRRGEEAHRRVPGSQPGSPPRLGPDLRHHPSPQAPAGDGPRLRPDGPAGVPPHSGDYPQGMATTVLFRNDTLPGRPTAYNLYNVLEAYYEGQTFVSVAPSGG